MYDEIFERFKEDISRGVYEFKVYGYEGTWKLRVVKYYPKDQEKYDLSNTVLMFINENYPDSYIQNISSGGKTGGQIYVFKKDPNLIYEVLDMEPEDYIVETYVNFYNSNIRLRKAMDLATEIGFNPGKYSYNLKFKASNGVELDIIVFPFLSNFSSGEVSINRILRDVKIGTQTVSFKSFMKRKGLQEVFDAKKFLDNYKTFINEFGSFTKKDAENLYNFVKNFVETVEIPDEIIEKINWINETAKIEAEKYADELRNVIKKAA